jgi:hypothetical protein
VFIGARSSGLPGEWQERLAAEAGQLALLLQKLSYFGPCSFDAILVGKEIENAELHWVECNGRWGGVSIPLALAHRLTRQWPSPPFFSIHRVRVDDPPPNFSMFLDSVRDKLFRASAGYRDGVVFVSAGNSMEGLHFMVLTDSTAASIEQSKIVEAIFRGCGHVRPGCE